MLSMKKKLLISILFALFLLITLQKSNTVFAISISGNKPVNEVIIGDNFSFNVTGASKAGHWKVYTTETGRYPNKGRIKLVKTSANSFTYKALYYRTSKNICKRCKYMGRRLY